MVPMEKPTSWIVSSISWTAVYFVVILWRQCGGRFPSNQIRRSKFPGNMHNYIWCPYYLPSFMKFCSVVSEELRWQIVWRTDGRTGQKQYVYGGEHNGGRHNYTYDLLCVIQKLKKNWLMTCGQFCIEVSLSLCWPPFCFPVAVETGKSKLRCQISTNKSVLCIIFLHIFII